MKTTTILTEIKVSDCGRYCHQGIKNCHCFIDTSYGFSDSAFCSIFYNKKTGNPVTLKQDRGYNWLRCRQCLQAERKAGKE
jgi:hypothetical protein